MVWCHSGILLADPYWGHETPECVPTSPDVWGKEEDAPPRNKNLPREAQVLLSGESPVPQPPPFISLCQIQVGWSHHKDVSCPSWDRELERSKRGYRKTSSELTLPWEGQNEQGDICPSDLRLGELSSSVCIQWVSGSGPTASSQRAKRSPMPCWKELDSKLWVESIGRG